MRAYASGGYYANSKTPDDLAEEALRYKKMGFSAFKMKIGGMSLNDDIERISAVRQAVGDEMEIAVDANCTYDLTEAKKMVRRMEPFDIKFFEEPISADNLLDSRELARYSPIPIAGYETELGMYAMKEVITNRSVNIAQVDAIWSGGITECKKIAILAECYRMQIIPHFSAGVISFYANLHFAASCSNCPIIEFTLDPNPMRDDLADMKPKQEKGYVILPDKPGLGIEINRDVLRNYMV